MSPQQSALALSSTALACPCFSISSPWRSWSPARPVLHMFFQLFDVAMDQYLLIPFLVGWTSIYQLFWCELQGYKVLTHCHVSTCFNLRLLSEDLARRRRDASQLEAALGMRGGLGKCGTWHWVQPDTVLFFERIYIYILNVYCMMRVEVSLESRQVSCKK